MTPNELKRRRRQLSLTQVQLAELLGVTSLAVSYWERGTRTMNEPTARLIRTLKPTPQKTRRTTS